MSNEEKVIKTPEKKGRRKLLFIVGGCLLFVAILLTSILASLGGLSTASQSDFTQTPSTATSSSSQTRRPMRDFKQLPLAQGNSLAGYSGEGTISAQEVVNRFGSPSKTEDVGDFFNSRVLYYPATDEFGNPCLAALVFYRGNAEGCGNASAPLRCYGLYNVAAR